MPARGSVPVTAGAAAPQLSRSQLIPKLSLTTANGYGAAEEEVSPAEQPREDPGHTGMRVTEKTHRSPPLCSHQKARRDLPPPTGSLCPFSDQPPHELTHAHSCTHTHTCMCAHEASALRKVVSSCVCTGRGASCQDKQRANTGLAVLLLPAEMGSLHQHK